MDMDNEIESIDNQSEEVVVAAAAAAASIVIGLIEQKADDEDCAGAHGEEDEEEEPKAKQRRRSYPRPTVSTWNRRGDSGYGSSKSCILRKVGLTRIAGRHGSSSLLFESPTRCSSASSRPWRLHFQLQHTTSPGRECIPVELKVRLVFMALSVRSIMACACRPVR